MRVLFSSTRGTGHLQPLLAYAHALRAHGHEVLVAAPAEVGEVLREAGLAHAPFDHPGGEMLAPIWARFREAPAAERVLANTDFGRGARRIADEIAALPPTDAAVARLVAIASRLTSEG